MEQFILIIIDLRDSKVIQNTWAVLLASTETNVSNIKKCSDCSIENRLYVKSVDETSIQNLSDYPVLTRADESQTNLMIHYNKSFIAFPVVASSHNSFSFHQRTCPVTRYEYFVQILLTQNRFGIKKRKDFRQRTSLLTSFEPIQS